MNTTSSSISFFNLKCQCVSIIRKVQWSEGSVVRRFSGPTIQWLQVQWSDGSVVLRFSGPNVQYSDASVVRMFSGHTVN